MADTTTTRLTAAEFEEQFAGEGCIELVRGEVVELSPGGMGHHSRPSANITYLLETWARRTKLGRVVTNEAGIITEQDPDTVRGADVAYFSYERLPKGQMPEGFSTIAPNLAVEVLGRGQGWGRVMAKVGEYLAMGVDRVWVADLGDRSLYVFRGDAQPERLEEADTVRDELLLPGFSCRVSEIFED